MVDRRAQFDDLMLQSGGDEAEVGGVNSAFTFLCIVLFLTGMGLAMLYSASYDEAISHGLPHYYYLAHQMVFVGFGIVMSLVIRFVPVKWFRIMTYPLLLVSLLLMLMTNFSSFGYAALGAKRWLRIGPFSLQPVEVAKLSMIFFLAYWFSTEHKNHLMKIIVPFAVMVLFASLIVLQKDFSSTMVFVGLCLAVFIAGGVGLGPLFLMMASIAVPSIVILFTVPYRVQRIASFLMPNLDPQSINYQVINSIKAIKRGGLLGVGLGNGTYKLGLIPEVQNDFIFANMCEELGLVWVLFIIILFGMFAFLGYKTYRRMVGQDVFLANLDFGMTTMIVWQAIINIAVVSGLLPPTGIPLPFFSQGGTNLFVVLCCCAVMYRIMMISNGKLPLQKSSLKKKERETIEFPSDAEIEKT
ncbi:MAG: FtsW/RodA/SpoVE family cell cycle protein [Sphaerochaetaceae bacterium]